MGGDQQPRNTLELLPIPGKRKDRPIAHGGHKVDLFFLHVPPHRRNKVLGFGGWDWVFKISFTITRESRSRKSPDVVADRYPMPGPAQ